MALHFDGFVADWIMVYIVPNCPGETQSNYDYVSVLVSRFAQGDCARERQACQRS